MKNQYFGDIGDYEKYGLLKFLGERDLKIAVNWYLTKDYNRPGDGKFTKYLKKEEEYSKYDKGLFDTLQKMLLLKPGNRDVKLFELKNAIPGAIYYHGQLSLHDLKTVAERKAHRDEWHRKALMQNKSFDDLIEKMGMETESENKQ